MLRKTCYLFLVVVLLQACGREKTTRPKESIFTEITTEARLNFTHDPGVDGSYWMPESMGSGGAFLDYDNDDRLDIYLINSGPHPGKALRAKNRLFRQNPDGKFVDVTDSSGLGDPGYGMGTAVADYNNDGFVDVYITNYGEDALYRNNGDGTFTNVTKEAGIHNPAWGTSAVFFDYDRDGLLDLYVANYLAYDPGVKCLDKAGRPDYCGPKAFPGVPDVLFHNNGDETFSDVSKQSGIASASYRGLGVLTEDFNRDSFPDLYVANDGEPNLLWINRGDGTFEDKATALGAALNNTGQAEASMGVTAGDVDSDGDIDLFMTHLRDEKNTLYRNHGAYFEDDSWAAGVAGISTPYTGFGSGFFDYDHDGDLDLAIVNGRVTRGPLLTPTRRYWDDYAEPNLLLENDGTGKFRTINEEAGSFASTIENSRGLAFGDVDNDGDIDLLVMNEGGPARLYRNDHKPKGHWLVIRAWEPLLQRDAIGAEVTLVVGAKKMQKTVSPAYSYLSSNDPRLHFGLGSATSVNSIIVQWVDGSIEEFPGTAADRFLIIKRGEGKEVVEKEK